MRTFVVTGATGKIGNLVTRELLAKGEKVRAIARSKEKLAELAALGAETLQGDAKDREFITKAFSGATAVFCLVMPDMFSAEVRKEQDQIAENYYHAVKDNQIKNVVLLSSVGADLRKGAGIVDGLGYMEDLFLQLKDVNVLNLRPTYFMENTLGQIGTIKHMGIAGTPIKGDLKFPIVATKDIAVVAAKRLLNLDFQGNTVEYVLGPKDYSYNEMTRIIGEVIGKPDLKYIKFSYEDGLKGMVAAGFCGEEAAQLMVDLAKGMNEGKVARTDLRTPENSTPTTYEEFAQLFAMIYKS